MKGLFGQYHQLQSELLIQNFKQLSPIMLNSTQGYQAGLDCYRKVIHHSQIHEQESTKKFNLQMIQTG